MEVNFLTIFGVVLLCNIIIELYIMCLNILIYIAYKIIKHYFIVKIKRRSKK